MTAYKFNGGLSDRNEQRGGDLMQRTGMIRANFEQYTQTAENAAKIEAYRKEQILDEFIICVFRL